MCVCRYDIKSTHLVVHDFSVSVAQELLYREPKRRLPVQLHKIFFLNGEVVTHTHTHTATHGYTHRHASQHTHRSHFHRHTHIDTHGTC